MTIRELIEKLEHVSEHRLESEVRFWVHADDAAGKYIITSIEDVGDAIEVELDWPPYN